jgi:hypothetical protein
MMMRREVNPLKDPANPKLGSGRGNGPPLPNLRKAQH